MNESVFNGTMADMNWKEIEELGHKNIPVLFPIGVIEEHGPHLPLGTDIYFSYSVCKNIKEEMEKRGEKCLIAPPCYWGINHCTGGFTGSFSLKPDTMRSMLYDIFENLHTFGFDRIYCFNFHGDYVHINAILDAAKKANEELSMNVRTFMEFYQLGQYGLSENEKHIFLNAADYPEEIFEEEEDRKELYDIHAGSFETAAMKYFYPDSGFVNEELVEKLTDCSLTCETINEWMKGGESTRKVVPLGYAGNPAGYRQSHENIAKNYEIMAENATGFISSEK